MTRTEPGAPIADRLVAALRTGTMVDLIPDTPTGGMLDEDEMRGWGDGHDVDAELLRNLLLQRSLDGAGPDPRGLRLRGARIRGRLDLDLVDTTVVLWLVDCLLDHGGGRDATARARPARFRTRPVHRRHRDPPHHRRRPRPVAQLGHAPPGSADLLGDLLSGRARRGAGAAATRGLSTPRNACLLVSGAGISDRPASNRAILAISRLPRCGPAQTDLRSPHR
jgi:hypothetical protein